MSADRAAPGPLLPRTRAELREMLAAVVVCQVVGAAGAAAGAGGVRDWLPMLDKPRYQPPGWVFGPVWTVLYTTMGISIAAVRRARGDDADRRRAQQLFAIQLAVNGLWTYLFFGQRSPGAGLADAVLIVAAVAATVRAIWRVHRPAALLLLPYLAWCCFALALTADITKRNPQAGRLR